MKIHFIPGKSIAYTIIDAYHRAGHGGEVVRLAHFVVQGRVHRQNSGGWVDGEGLPGPRRGGQQGEDHTQPALHHQGAHIVPNPGPLAHLEHELRLQEPEDHLHEELYYTV